MIEELVERSILGISVSIVCMLGLNGVRLH